MLKRLYDSGKCIDNVSVIGKLSSIIFFGAVGERELSMANPAIWENSNIGKTIIR